MKMQHRIDMTQGSLAGKIVKFALPLMASAELQLLFNAVDVVVVGRYAGKEALAAVSSNTSLINLLVALFMGLSIGANVVVARDLGAGQHDRVKRSAHTAVFLALASGLFLMVGGVAAARALLTLMGSPDDVIGLATVYLRIFFLGMPASMLYNFGSALLRAQGDTRRPLIYLAVSGVVNVVLNLFFVTRLHMNVDGVAIATVIAQYISAALVLHTLMKETGPLHIELRQIYADKEMAKQIFVVGVPAGLQSIVFSLSNVTIQSTINSFGSVAMSGNGAAGSIEGFVYTAGNAFSQTSITFVGQNYGAGQYKRVDRSVLYCTLFAMGTALLLGNLVYFFGEPLLGIYAPDEPEVIAYGMVRVAFLFRLHFICGVMDAMGNVLRGLGHSFEPMVVSMLGACGIRLFWVHFIFPLDPTLQNIYISYPVSWAVTAVAQIIMFLVVRKRIYGKCLAAPAKA